MSEKKLYGGTPMKIPAWLAQFPAPPAPSPDGLEWIEVEDHVTIGAGRRAEKTVRYIAK